MAQSMEDIEFEFECSKISTGIALKELHSSL